MGVFVPYTHLTLLPCAVSLALFVEIVLSQIPCSEISFLIERGILIKEKTDFSSCTHVARCSGTYLEGWDEKEKYADCVGERARH